jgi:uncharacterized membrane protein
VLLVVALVLGLGSVAMAGATAGRASPEERRERMAAVLGVMGALVTGFGVILFFAANWGDIPRWLRVASLIAGMALLYGLGYYLREVRRTNLHVAHALIFLGTVLFGASLFLVGQMYHVQAHDPMGFLIWAIGCLLVAVLVRSGPIAALGLLVLTAWIAHEVIDLSGTVQETAVLLPVILTLYGIALYGLGTGASRWLAPLRFERPTRMIGFALVALGIFPFTFRFVNQEGFLGDPLTLTEAKVLMWGFAAAALVGCVVLALLFRVRPTSLAEAVVLAAAGLLVVLAVVAPEVGDARGEFTGDEGTVYPLLFNVLLAVLAVGAIVVGFLNDEVWLANAGVVWVGIDVIARFFDPSWSMLERSLVLIPAGLVAIAAGYLLERRRQMPGVAT